MARRVHAGRQAPDDLRRGGGGPVDAARVDALGREGEVEVATGPQPGALEHRRDLLAGRARVGGALEHDQVAGAQAPRQALGRAQHGRQVGLAVLGERGRKADQDGVDRAQRVPGRGGAHRPLPHQRGEPFGRHVLDVGLARVDAVDLRLDRVQPEDRDAGLAEGHRERQADVAEPDHPDPGCVAAQRRGDRVAGWRSAGRQRPVILVVGDTHRKEGPLRPESALAGLPRLVRVAGEARWRGQSAVATAIVVGLYWGATWLVGETIEADPCGPGVRGGRPADVRRRDPRQRAPHPRGREPLQPPAAGVGARDPRELRASGACGWPGSCSPGSSRCSSSSASPTAAG